jgi:hypothetical protein
MKKRKPSRTQVPADRTHLVWWTRFSNERTPKTAREWLCNRLENHIGCTVSAPCSLGQVVTAICEKAQHAIPIELLSLQLQTPVLSRALVTFGSAWNEIDKIANNYPNMKWWISERGLTMQVVIPPPPPQDFDQLAGKLVFEMRQKFPKRSLSRDQYLEIAAQLDNFNVLDLLPKGPREELAAWNEKNGQGAIHTFSEAIAAKQPRGLGRETIRRLYRAHDKFKRRQNPF